MDRTVYEKSSTCIWKPSRPRQRGLILARIEVDQPAKSADLSGLLAIFPAAPDFFQLPLARKNKRP
jgi:hypothetical protein